MTAVTLTQRFGRVSCNRPITGVVAENPGGDPFDQVGGSQKLVSGIRIPTWAISHLVRVSAQPHGPVELPGIEPGSYGIPSRLLRAQSAMSLLGSPGHADQPG